MTQPEPSGPTTGQVALGVGAVALAGGAPDPWLPLRWRRLVGMLRAERSLFRAYSGFLSKWIDRVRGRVVHRQVVDPVEIYAMRGAFTLGVGEIVDVQLREIYTSAWHEVMVAAPVPPSRVETYLQGAHNRMSGTPDHVYALVKAEVLKAHNEGSSISELAARVELVLSDNEVATWKNRSVVVARTEAIGAYNAGTHAGFLSYAAQLGGAWEHGWLATHDERVRPTHIAADLATPGSGQRVPLDEPFAVGEALLDYPGAIGPRALPEEVIQCRCSQVLLRPGEDLDVTHRHRRGKP